MALAVRQFDVAVLHPFLGAEFLSQIQFLEQGSRARLGYEWRKVLHGVLFNLIVEGGRVNKSGRGGKESAMSTETHPGKHPH